MAQDTQPRPVENEECPLCRVVLQKPRRAFIKHVGRHMEEIALMALPRNSGADSDEVSTRIGPTSLESKNSKMLAAMTRSESHEMNELYVDGYEFLESTLNQQLVSKEDSPSTSPHIGLAAQSYAGVLSSPMLDEGTDPFWAHCGDSGLATARKFNQCSNCYKMFKRPCDLTKHEKTHSRPWKCIDSRCKYAVYGWTSERERDRHVNEKHVATPVMYKCIYRPCPYKSKKESDCMQHMEKDHNWSYACSKGARKVDREPLPRLSVEESNGSHCAEERDLRRFGQVADTGRDIPRISSYWTVPEQQDFYSLVRRFGTDWQAIATAMKTKTDIMVYNFSSLIYTEC